MKNFRFGLIALAATCLLTTTAIAQNPVGAWKGKLNLDLQMPPTKDPQMKAMVEQQLAALKKVVIHLNIKSNNTYEMKTTGTPANLGGDQTDSGTWKRSGRTVTIVSTKKGKGGPKEQKVAISTDGKTMVLNLPGPDGKSGGYISFKRS